MESKQQRDEGLIEKTIKVWEAKKKVDTVADVRLGMQHCPLCFVYHHDQCDGCPIKERTGDIYCVGTPYPNVADEKERLILDNGPFTKMVDIEAERLIQAIDKQIEFLKSLRTPKKRGTFSRHIVEKIRKSIKEKKT